MEREDILEQARELRDALSAEAIAGALQDKRDAYIRRLCASEKDGDRNRGFVDCLEWLSRLPSEIADAVKSADEN